MDFSPEYTGEAVQGKGGDDFDGGSGDGEPGDQPSPGTGQSKSSKRRRRKRKKLAVTGVAGAESSSEGEGGGYGAAGGIPESGANTTTYVPLILEGESLSLAASSAAQPAANSQRRGQGGGGQPSQANVQGSFQANGHGTASARVSENQSNGPNSFQNGGPAANGQTQGKRWKKKFRDRERRPQGEPNAGSNGLGGERAAGSDRVFERPQRREGGRPDNFGNLVTHQHKAKPSGGKDRGFVGPMDHSYREANSQFGEGPPSTIQLRGRRGHRQQGDGQPVDHNAPRALPIAEDAQTHIYLFVEDLFVAAKVQETARKLGVKVAFIKNDKDAIAELTSGEEPNRPTLIVFDLNNANAKPLTLIPKLKAKLKRSASIVGFLSTIQGDLKAKAVEAGCDSVMPKAAFSQNLPNLLRRYGTEEAEEVNFNY